MRLSSEIALCLGKRYEMIRWCRFRWPWKSGRVRPITPDDLRT